MLSLETIDLPNLACDVRRPSASDTIIFSTLSFDIIDCPKVKSFQIIFFFYSFIRYNSLPQGGRKFVTSLARAK